MASLLNGLTGLVLQPSQGPAAPTVSQLLQDNMSESQGASIVTADDLVFTAQQKYTDEAERTECMAARVVVVAIGSSTLS